MTCPHCRESARFVEHREKDIVSLVGLIRLSRCYYHCCHCHRGHFPWDQTLRLSPQRLSPGAQEVVCLAGIQESFGKAAERTLRKLAGLSLSESTVERTTEGTGARLGEQWQKGNVFGPAQPYDWHKDASGELSILEYGLDISGGATAGTFKQFIVRFDDELKKYDKFILGGPGGEDIFLAEVTNEKLENIFKTQGINFQRKVNNAGVVMFDFELNGQKLRMYNFGGKDLMIDAHFRKISLEDANRYNLNRKFVRAVNYKGKDVEYTALENNLDCEVGVTEGMIRNWINSFGDDARHFSEFCKKLQTPEKK